MVGVPVQLWESAVFAWMWPGPWCQIKEAVHPNMTDADSSSGSAEPAENAINVNYSFKKCPWNICRWEKGSEWGEGAVSVGSPTEPRGLFQYLK